MKLYLLALSVLASSLAIDLPAGLRPAKAVGDSEAPIVPSAEQSDSPSNVRTPPNLSLRSRMIAALNSPADESQETTSNRAIQKVSSSSETSTTEQPLGKAPVIFEKKKKGRKSSGTPVTAPVNVVQPTGTSRALPRVTVPPPEGKNYGVNTLVQVNLVDSKGSVVRGAKAVPIRVPSSAEVRNAKSSRASASQVESEADKVVPVKFGRAN
ncbi:Protein C02F4.4 [Aphelenchoides avenae]|nr:Protein C02F4.4 [Aphelenchus avenae]